MDVKIAIPDYNKGEGFAFEWENNFNIEVKIVDNKVLIIANKQGLISLAKHFINLSQDHFDAGYDIHFDSYNSLEENSNELIIQKG